ncbi:MAG: carboxypeptidase regulatory-like domain-containing protein [Acidobacteria bacterium]|nr:carboxypeptidase regulatory-like domain-containing protein [Acidobacteriota bacterium]
MRQKSLLLSTLLSALFAMLGSSVLLAQGTTSRLTGTVTDQSGAAVPGATVTLTNEATNISFKTQTSDTGAYAFDLIQAGTYQVTVEKTGFKKFVSNNNVAQINQPATVNVAMQVGEVSSQVTVEATADVVQTSSSGNIGSTINQKSLESLPIVGTRGRNPLDLLNFQPGVVVGGNTGGGVNVHGSRDRAFNFTLDGVDINETSAGGSNFTPLRPNPDSLQEFQLVTANATAEFGRSSGAQGTLVTRSGSNQIHGNAFEYYQTPRFNAKSYTGNINNLPKDQFVQHIFGGGIGGPIIKNKLFYFGNLQLLRAYDTALVTRTVYTQAARDGVYRYVVGRANAPNGSATPAVDASGNALVPACSATVTTLCLATYNIANNPANITRDTTLLAALNAQPLPNNFNTGDGLNTAGFNFGSPQHEKQYDFVTKVDYTLNERNTIYVRYAQGAQNTFGDSANGGRPIFPTSPNLVDTFRNPKNLAINYRWNPTTHLINEFVLGLNKFAFAFNTPQPDPAASFSFINVATANTNFISNARKLRTWQFIDNVTLDYSPHVIKTGLNFRYGRHTDDRSSVAGIGLEPTVSLGGAAGYTGFNLPVSSATGINATDLTRLQNTINDQLGRVSSVAQAFVSDPNNPSQFAPLGTRWNFTANYPELDFYGQDSWRMRPNFVVDLGVRWEVKLNPRSDGRPILVPNLPFTLGNAGTNALKWVPGSLFKNDFKKILPSIGFAWDPFKSGKTSIRGNYRIASDRLASQLLGANVFQNIPGNALGATNAAFGQGGGLFRNVAPVIAALVPSSTPDALRQPAAFSTSSINVFDPDFQFPQVHSWSLSYQKEIAKQMVVEINYIGKHGAHLTGGYNANQVNINAKVSGQSESFLDAFNGVRNSTTYNSPLINLLLTGNAANNAGTALFRTLNTTALTQGSVAALAVNVSQRLCVAANVTAGVCTSAQLNQRLLDINGFSSLLQPFSQFTGGLNVFDSSDYSNYHALEVILRRTVRGGNSFQLGYTLAKSLDNRSWDPTFSTVSTANNQSASSTPFNNANRRLNYAWSDFDRRHSLQGTYVYQLPFGNGRKFFSGLHRSLDTVIGGWQLAGTLTVTSGRPFTVYSGLTTFSNVVNSLADCNGCSRNEGKLVVESGKNFWFDATSRAKFSAPAPGSIGNTGRNFFLEPRYFQTDISLSKNFRLTERFNFDLRVDARNFTNTPSFAAPTATLTSTIFGRINDSVNSAARRIQFSGKINF